MHTKCAQKRECHFSVGVVATTYNFEVPKCTHFHVAQRGTLLYRRMPSGKPSAATSNLRIIHTKCHHFVTANFLLTSSQVLTNSRPKNGDIFTTQPGNLAPEPLAGSPFALANRSDKLLFLT
jgi:hypothetical protein